MARDSVAIRTEHVYDVATYAQVDRKFPATPFHNWNLFASGSCYCALPRGDRRFSSSNQLTTKLS